MRRMMVGRRFVLRERAICCLIALAAIWVAGAASVQADTLNVPADHATIQAAIDAAAEGDTVLVAPGTYTEFVNINKAGLILISSAGAATTIIENNVNNDTPIVDITAPGVTLGGAGAGFTINQLDPGPAAIAFSGNCAVRIRGELASSAVNPTTLTIEDCILTGNETDEGLLVNEALTRAHLVVKNSSFTRNGGNFSFRQAIHFRDTFIAGQLSTGVSANECTIDLLDLDAAEFDLAGVEFYDHLHKSTVNIVGGTYAGRPNANGLSFGGHVMNFSTVTIDGVTINAGQSAIYVDDDLKNQSSMVVQNATLQGFSSNGVYVSYVEHAGELTVRDSAITGNGTAGTGVSAYVQDAGRLQVEHCTISGVRDYGVECQAVYYGASVSIINNTIAITAAGGSGYGIYTETEHGSTTIIRDNTITGFNYAGVYEQSMYAGCTLVIADNILAADAAGAPYGIYMDQVYYASMVEISNNTATNFTSAGIDIESCEYGSTALITGNTLTALASTGASYGIKVAYTHRHARAFIENNAVAGYTDAGLYVDRVYYGGEVTAADNVFDAHSTGAVHGIYAYEIYEGGTASFSGNQVSGFGNTGGSDYGFYNEEVEDGARLTLRDNTFTAHANLASYGLHSSSGFQNAAFVDIIGNTFTGFNQAGMYLHEFAYDGTRTRIVGNTFEAGTGGAIYGLDLHSVDFGSQGVIENNTISGFKEFGIYIDSVDDGSRLHLRNNALMAAPGGTADLHGIYFEYSTGSGSYNEVSGNTISGIIDPDDGGGNAGFGIYVQGAEEGSIETVSDNTVIGDGSGETYGVYLNYVADDGGVFELLRNQISGFTEAAIYLHDDTESGSRLYCADNRTQGGRYGIYYNDNYDINQGSTVLLERNRIRGFTETGLFVGGFIYASKVEIRLNHIAGDAADHGIFFNKQMDSGAEVSLISNCISGVVTGVSVEDILDTSFVLINYNDLSGTTTGIVNVSGDADHTIDGRHNFFGAATPATGNVDTSSELASPPDEDGDGVIDCEDECPGTPAGQDADANGCSCLQLFPELDTDGDSTLDCLDGCPNDPLKVEPGVCGCGEPDTDTDGDGTPDCVDGCPSDPDKTEPGVCGCGTSDVDSDGDGTPNCIDECPADPNKTAAGVCGCGVSDVDSDGDGTSDCNDGCPADPDKIEPGVCGCGVADTDTDGDGTPDCIDECPADPDKTAAGVCGCGIADTDSDGDGIPDCLDQCPAEAGPVSNFGCPEEDGGDDDDGDDDDGDDDDVDDDNGDDDDDADGDQPTPLCGAGLCGAGGAGLLPLTLLGLLGMRVSLRRRRC